jgi:hypothetical protein
VSEMEVAGGGGSEAAAVWAGGGHLGEEIAGRGRISSERALKWG